MTHTSKLAALCGAVGLALIAISGSAVADGYEVAAPAAADEGRKFTYSFNIGATSDYVFRGISQNDNDPTIQGGIDFGYGILYAGVWASGINFDAIVNDADLEVDWYGGIKPTWGPATFDFGVIYYSYPGAGYHDAPAVRLRSELRRAEGRRQRQHPQGLARRRHRLLVARLLRRDRQRVDLRRLLPATRSTQSACSRRASPASSAIRRLGRLLRRLERLQRLLVLERRPRAGGREDHLRLPLLGHGRLERTSRTSFTCINDYCDSKFVFSAKVVLP